MPFVGFSLKQFGLMVARNARAFAALAKLTPARADVLIALLSGELAQVHLVHTFGVCAPVVSRMVRELERLGLVSRRVNPRDRRMRLVSITNKGRAGLNVLFDGWMADDGEAHVQVGTEQELLFEWNEILAANGVRFEIPGGDAGPLLRQLRRTLFSEDYWVERGFRPDEAKRLRCFRNLRRAA